ncbi:MAG: hypothetical protein QW203_06505, partial [Thermoplasmatales archaeon]
NGCFATIPNLAQQSIIIRSKEKKYQLFFLGILVVPEKLMSSTECGYSGKLLKIIKAPLKD